MKRATLFVFGWLLLAIPAAHAQFIYTTNNGTINITGYTGTNDDVVIPSTIDGLPVTSIVGRWAYGWYSGFLSSGLTDLTIPNGVTNIGTYAFAACGSLTGVTIPNSVSSIGGFAFGRSGLTNVTIPNSVANIGDAAFSSCPNLTNIMVDPLNPAFSSVDGVLFNESQTTLVDYPAGKVGYYAIPNSVTIISSGAFADCSSLTSITMPYGVTSIGGIAFSGCSSLTNLTIPDSVTSVGDYAFNYCTSLTSVTIPSSVEDIGQGAFAYDFNLTSVFFSGNAPNVFGDLFFSQNPTHETIYYLAGTSGWASTLAGRPTALWALPYPLILNSSLGVQTNGLSFTASWATNSSVVVEASPDLGNPKWSPVATNTLTGGTFYFTDPQWTKYPSRFYRLRSP